jgi:undecaprenyl-diphosphatase
MDALASLDARALAWVLSLPHPGWLDRLMVGLSAFGQQATVWLALGAILAAWGRLPWKAYWQVVLSIVLTILVVDAALKPMVGRARPSHANPELTALVEPPATASFPSGHAATAVAGASALAGFLPRARQAFWLLALLIAASRVYLGLHYPLDVVAGALVGLGCAALSVGGTVWYSGDPAVRVFQRPR